MCFFCAFGSCMRAWGGFLYPRLAITKSWNPADIIIYCKEMGKIKCFVCFLHYLPYFCGLKGRTQNKIGFSL